MKCYQVESHSHYSGYDSSDYTIGIYTELSHAIDRAIVDAVNDLRYADGYKGSYTTITAWFGEEKEQLLEYNSSGYTPLYPNDPHVLGYLLTYFPKSNFNEGTEFLTWPMKINELNEALKEKGFMKLCRYCLGPGELPGSEYCQACIDEEKRLDDEWEIEKKISSQMDSPQESGPNLLG